MKKTLLIFLFFISLAFGALAQGLNNNIVIFSEQGEQFNLIINGIQQNSQPETNVVVRGLSHPNYKVKIIFADNNIPDLDKNLFINDNTETTYKIKQTKKGVYVLRFQSEISIMQAPQPMASQTVIVYSTTPVPTQVTNVTYTETTTTTVGNDPYNENVNVNMNMGSNPNGANINMNVNDGNGENVNINMNVNANPNGANMNMNVSETSSYTNSTTTTTTTTNGGNYNNNYNQPPPPPQPIYQEVVYVPGYTGSVGCNVPMDQNAYRNAYSTIESKDFSDTKMTIAKQIIGARCITTDQLIGFLNLFDFESDKLELAKYAYAYTYDRGNYFMVNNVFDFESSIEELNDYILR